MSELSLGDCVEEMAKMEADSIDSIVTDPPYGLEFMGKEWDRLGATVEHPDDGEGPRGRTKRVRYGSSAKTAQDWHQRWAEAAFRVAKPSAYLLAFGGTRTVHRMTCAIEDAGWIIRDMLVWAYASGFPKSKASLKPAWEPIVMARKPGPLRMLAIDECRIPFADAADAADAACCAVQFGESMAAGRSLERVSFPTNYVKPPYVPGAGRWPANVILTDPIFDGGIEGVVGGGDASYNPSGVFGTQKVDQPTDTAAPFAVRREGDGIFGYADSGTYSRFFLVPKSARSDREPVLDEYAYRLHRERGDCDPATSRSWSSRNACGRCGKPLPRVGSHPTVKPTDLMRHLVRLVTPPGGTVLDPFLGSGTTAIAAEMEGFAWIGIEREAEYVQIAEARLNGTQRGLGIA